VHEITTANGSLLLIALVNLLAASARLDLILARFYFFQRFTISNTAVRYVREADNGIALTTQQILQIAGVLDSTAF
jgi:hypothetical protein